MRKLFIILGLIAAILAVVLCTLPLSNIAYIPAVFGLIFGILALVLSNKEKKSKNSIQLIFLLTIISLSISTYKAIFTTTEVGDTKELQDKEKTSEEEAIEELEDLDIEE